jgi:hypothetical protein
VSHDLVQPAPHVRFRQVEDRAGAAPVQPQRQLDRLRDGVAGQVTDYDRPPPGRAYYSVRTATAY